MGVVTRSSTDHTFSCDIAYSESPAASRASAWSAKSSKPKQPAVPDLNHCRRRLISTRRRPARPRTWSCPSATTKLPDSASHSRPICHS